MHVSAGILHSVERRETYMKGNRLSECKFAMLKYMRVFPYGRKILEIKYVEKDRQDKGISNKPPASRKRVIATTDKFQQDITDAEMVLQLQRLENQPSTSVSSGSCASSKLFQVSCSHDNVYIKMAVYSYGCIQYLQFYTYVFQRCACVS